MDINEEYLKLVKKIKSLQNGLVSESLTRMGISYALIFGLTIEQIKSLSLPYKGQNDFARFLWEKDIREAKLLALMIYNPNELSDDESYNLVCEFTNAELVEQSVIHLLTKQENAIENAIRFCHNESEFAKMTGYNLLARLSMSDNNISIITVNRILQFVKEDSKISSPHVMRSISFSLRKLGKINGEIKVIIIKLCDELEKTNNQSATWIATDTRIELEFTA